MARRKTKPFSAPKTAEVKAIIKRNPETSPLLKLPLEVKQKIYIDVLGERRILIKRTKTKDIHGDAPHNFASLLATSRRIYVEANPIFWSTNRFSFSHHLAFGAWMKKRNKFEKVALRNLFLMMDLTDYSRHWLRTLSEGVIKQLPGLVDLHLEIHLFKFGSDFDSSNDPNTLNHMYTYDSNFAPVRSLARLPLMKVEVDIRHNYPWNFISGGIRCTEGNRWTEPNRQLYADVIKRMLLDPDPSRTEARLEAQKVEKVEAEQHRFRSNRHSQIYA